jgi:erythromycin esterase-like protein
MAASRSNVRRRTEDLAERQRMVDVQIVGRGIKDSRVLEAMRRVPRDVYPRLERAIGVIYRPETELASHYFDASLPKQFDGYVWFEETRAVTPLSAIEREGLPETYPFGL